MILHLAHLLPYRLPHSTSVVTFITPQHICCNIHYPTAYLLPYTLLHSTSVATYIIPQHICCHIHCPTALCSLVYISYSTTNQLFYLTLVIWCTAEYHGVTLFWALIQFKYCVFYLIPYSSCHALPYSTPAIHFSLCSAIRVAYQITTVSTPVA